MWAAKQATPRFFSFFHLVCITRDSLTFVFLSLTPGLWKFHLTVDFVQKEKILRFPGENLRNNPEP